MSYEVNSSSNYCGYFTYLPCSCYLKIKKIFNERSLKTIGAGLGGAAFGCILGMSVVIFSAPNPAAIEEHDVATLNRIEIGAGAGAGVGAVFASSIYCLYGAKIAQCFVKICPKCCPSVNDGHLHTPILEENL